MKLAKALKLKNKLAGEVAVLKELLSQQNVRTVKQRFDYDNKEVLNDLRAKIDDLVKVKTSIATANQDVYTKIFRLAELKGLVSTLRALNVKAGVFTEAHGFGDPVFEVEYQAQIGKVEADRLIADLENEIQQLQDELDDFNFTRSVRP